MRKRDNDTNCQTGSSLQKYKLTFEFSIHTSAAFSHSPVQDVILMNSCVFKLLDGSELFAASVGSVRKRDEARENKREQERRRETNYIVTRRGWRNGGRRQFAACGIKIMLQFLLWTSTLRRKESSSRACRIKWIDLLDTMRALQYYSQLGPIWTAIKKTELKL